ncbi:MAG: hypothetical protein KF838_01240 [Phycisphaeraceae bacterium]|nr:MAG: hypothetical protein KF838_01240 [Phycisphaeraceae bacterium]
MPSRTRSHTAIAFTLLACVLTLAGNAGAQPTQSVGKRLPGTSNQGFPTRGYGVRAPFVRMIAPNTFATGGNRPSERVLPPRLDPRPPVVVAPSPGPSAEPQVNSPDPVNTIDLPITSGVAISTSVSAPASLNGYGVPTGVYTHASTRGATGWSRNQNDQYGPDPRLSPHYKPSEIAAIVAADQAREAAARVPVIERAASALQKGDAELAFDLYREHLSQYPDDLDAVRMLGVVELLLKRTDAGVKRIASVYASDPLMVGEPIDPANLPGGTTDLRRVSSDVAALASRGGRADAALVAAVLAQARQERAVATRFLDRAEAAGLDPALAARMRAELTPQTTRPSPAK